MPRSEPEEGVFVVQQEHSVGILELIVSSIHTVGTRGSDTTAHRRVADVPPQPIEPLPLRKVHREAIASLAMLGRSTGLRVARPVAALALGCWSPAPIAAPSCPAS